MTAKTTPKADPVGDVTEFPCTLAGKPVTLKVTAPAMVAVSRLLGGLVPAGERCRALDIAALGMLVHCGLGRPAASQLDALRLEHTINEVAGSDDIVEIATAASGMLGRMLSGPPKADAAAPGGEG